MTIRQKEKNDMKLSNNRLYCFAFLLTVTLAACTPEQRKAWFEPAPKNTQKVQEEIFDAPDIVGNLGGKPIRASAYVIDGINYEDTPTAFAKEWKTYNPPPRTYQSKLKDIWVYFNVDTGQVRDWRSMEVSKFGEERNMSGTPWVSASMQTNNAHMNTPEFLDNFLKQALKVKPIRPEDTYVKTSKNQYDLSVYEPLNRQGQERTDGAFFTDDLFIAWDKDGHVRSYIKCFNREVPNPPCSHMFQIKDKIKITVDLYYNRHRLHEWQKMEKQVENIIFDFVKNAELEPNNLSRQNRSK